jgi:nitroreductase
MQDWRFVVVTDKETKVRLAGAANEQMFLAKAAAIIVACSNSDHVMRCGQAIGPIDVAIALEHMALQAAELGLASCWIGSFYPEKIKPLLGIPQDVAIIELLAIGHPADKYATPKREPLENIVCYEKWQF